jgi:hypothetical protein
MLHDSATVTTTLKVRMNCQDWYVRMWFVPGEPGVFLGQVKSAKSYNVALLVSVEPKQTPTISGSLWNVILENAFHLPDIKRMFGKGPSEKRLKLGRFGDRPNWRKRRGVYGGHA